MRIGARITPATLWAGLSAAACGGAICRVLQLAQPGSGLTRVWEGSYAPSNLLAHAIAVLLCLRIAADHSTHSTMRIAWLLIAAGSVAAILRHGFEWLAFLAGWDQTMLTTLVSLRQIPIVLSLMLLIAGLVAMWSSFAAIGLGLRFRRSDAIVLVLVVAFVPSIFSLRENLNDAGSAYLLIRRLQSASPLLLAAPALVGLVLHRISQEMGGGQLAIALRCLVASLLLRLAAMLVTVSPELHGISGLAVPATAAGWAAQWLFALGVAYRWRLTVAASALADRYETNPAEEIVGLSEVLAQTGASRPSL